MGKFDLHGTKYINEEGKRVPSVTTIINGHLGWNKQALLGWTKRMMLGGQDSDKVLDEAAQIGTLLHLLIEGHQQGFDIDTKDYSYNQEKAAMKAFAGYLQWYEKVKFKPLRNELVLVNEELQVGGTVDAIAKKDNELIVVDWKTSKGGPYPEMIVQLGAYTMMYEAAQPKAKVSHGIIMRFGKEDGKFHQHVIDRKKLDAGAQVFKHCCALNKLRSAL